MYICSIFNKVYIVFLVLNWLSNLEFWRRIFFLQCVPIGRRVGGDLDKIQKNSSFFVSSSLMPKLEKRVCAIIFSSGHANTIFFAFCCKNWHIRWMNRLPVCRLKGWSKTCFLMVFHAILRQILIFCFCAISYCLANHFRKGGRGIPQSAKFLTPKNSFFVIGFWTLNLHN